METAGARTSEQEGENFKPSKGTLNTAWLVKCSQEQKELLQRKAADSGKGVAQFLVDSVQAAALKTALDNEEDAREFREMDSLIDRLHKLLNAKMAVLLEKERHADKLKASLLQKEQDYQNDIETQRTELVREFEEHKRQVEAQFQKALQQEQDHNAHTLAEKEADLLKAVERAEHLEGQLSAMGREKEALYKQYTESMRSYEIADERLMELRLKVKDLEAKCSLYDQIKAKKEELEKDLHHASLKMEFLVKEEALKREALEKDLKRGFEMELLKLGTK